MRFAYADPPYPGMAEKHYAEHADFDGEVDHAALIERLRTGYPDGWALSTNSTALRQLLPLCPPNVRVLAWVKSFASWKRNVYPAYAWEPVLLVGGRNRYGDVQTPADFIAEPITLERGVSGAKPERFCFWLFECFGAMLGDELDDLFPGSGAVTRAWRSFLASPRLDFPAEQSTLELT